jgi:hypothetical protein
LKGCQHVLPGEGVVMVIACKVHALQSTVNGAGGLLLSFRFAAGSTKSWSWYVHMTWQQLWYPSYDYYLA